MVYLDRSYQVKFFKGCLPQLYSVQSILNTVSQIKLKFWDLSKSINWFLYDMNLYHERVKRTLVCQKPRGVFTTPWKTQDGVFLQSFIAYLIQGRECVYEKPIYNKPGTRRTKNLRNFYCFILQLQEIF